MTRNEIVQPLRTQRIPVVIGTGLVALDVVIPNGLVADPQLCAGGTCGNVLTALAFLGWRSYPIARLSEDGASKDVAADLRQWGVILDFVTFDDDGKHPGYRSTHSERTRSGDTSLIHFRGKCPMLRSDCFLGIRPVRVADVTDLVPRLPKPASVFFDRTVEGGLVAGKSGTGTGSDGVL